MGCICTPVFVPRFNGAVVPLRNQRARVHADSAVAKRGELSAGPLTGALRREVPSAGVLGRVSLAMALWWLSPLLLLALEEAGNRWIYGQVYL